MVNWDFLRCRDVVGTGDFTHPAWFKELQEKLEPAEEGLFKLKKKYQKVSQEQCPEACVQETRFMLTVEISNIYKRLDHS